MKKIAAITALVLALVLVLSACGSKIEGTWSLTDAKSSNSGDSDDIASGIAMIKAFGGDITFTFKNGKVTYKMNVMGQYQEETWSYKTSGSKLIITQDGNKNEMTYKVSGDKLTISQDGNELIFTKK